MFWIWNKNGADNTLVFWVLLSHVSPTQGVFFLPCLMLCQWGATQRKLGGSIAGRDDPNCPKRYFTPWNIIPGSGVVTWKTNIWVQEEVSGVSQQIASNCIMHHLIVSILLSLFLSSSFSIITILYFIFTFQLLNCSYLNIQVFSLLLSIPLGVGRRGCWATGFVVLNFQLSWKTWHEVLLILRTFFSGTQVDRKYD